MESSNLLKQCRTNTTTAAAPFPKSPLQWAENGGVDSDDEGPFFDLEVITIPEEKLGDETDESKAGDDDKELNFIFNSPEHENFPFMLPSDDFFPKSRLAPRQPKPQFYLSNTKRATSFRIRAKEPNFMPKQSKYFVTLNVADVPMETLFAGKDSAGVFASEEKASSSNSKDAVHKYFGKIKPLYFRVSKKYAEKFSLFLDEKGRAKAEDPAVKTGEKCQKPAMPAKLRLACKKLGKSKSASSAMTAASSPQRRDESALMQQDGIQSAIVHCKRSFNAASEGARLKSEN